MDMIRHCCFVRFQKISKITLKKRLLGIPQGRGASKAKILKGNY